MLLFNQNNKFKQTKLWTVGVANLRFYLDLERVMFCKIENGFFTSLFSLRIFEDSKTRKCCFLYKTTRLSRQFWKMSVALWNFAYGYRDRCYLGQKMGSSDFFSLIANIIVLLWHTEFASFESFESFNMNI